MVQKAFRMVDLKILYPVFTKDSQTPIKTTSKHFFKTQATHAAVLESPKNSSGLHSNQHFVQICFRKHTIVIALIVSFKIESIEIDKLRHSR